MEQKNELSIWQWIGTLFLASIPLVNYIVLLIWAFGSTSARKNFSRAILILHLIGIGIWVAFIFILDNLFNYRY